MTDASTSMNEALTGVRAIYDLLEKTNDAQLAMAISSEASKVQTALIDVQRQLLSPQSGSQEGADDDRQTGFGRWLKRHRRSIVLVGAIIMLATYFLRDVVSENVKEGMSKASAAATEYNSSLLLRDNQTADLIGLERLLSRNAPVPSHDSIVDRIGVLYDHSLQIESVIDQLAGRIPGGVPKPIYKDLDEIRKNSENIKNLVLPFLDQPPSDDATFRSTALSLVNKMNDLDTSMAKSGAALQVLEIDESENMDRKASIYGYGVTLLYLVALLLTVVGSLYGIDVPGSG
jgi:hypothetical protein